MEEKTIERRILNRMIDQSHLCLGRQPKRQRRNPFPVAVMTCIDDTRLSLLYQLGNHLRALEHHASFHILSSDRHVFHRFHYQVAEKMIKVMFYLSDFRLRLLWERRRKVLSYHLLTIAYHFIQQKIQTIGDDIMNPHWQEREQIPTGID